MLKRLKNLLKNESKSLIKRFENPINVLTDAKEELFTKAVSCERKSLELKDKLGKIQDGPSKEKLSKLAVKLHEQAVVYKKKHSECDEKIAELSARKLAAETMLEALKDVSGALKDAGPLSVINEIEEDIRGLEREVEALVNISDFGV